MVKNDLNCKKKLTLTMEPDHETNGVSKLDKVEHDILDVCGWKRADLEKLKELELHNIGEEARKVLKEEATVRSPVDTKNLKSLQKAENEEDRSNVAPNVPSSPNEDIASFLRERCLSRSLIATLLKTGPTSEFFRLLTAMGFADEDVETLKKLWDARKDKDVDSSWSVSSSSDEYLSSDGLYLRNFLRKPLSQGLREIVAKKPIDPIEYLGHWLLNYKICEERFRRQKEFELELMIERERVKPRDLEDETSVLTKHEEEEEEEEGTEYRTSRNESLEDERRS
ncbi:uncharacterized protein LOC128893180 isoform X1 [Hylaeus anthracinus]|uniref:uncharacterized protein LOC128893172 isoform X1 n=1 Tax=Hylaeus anthracinus TaxID=313031 RepID=UPI0023B9D495|nr:uncharacterized protein LOC128893172 isoform X1 [Hylaeus anthracinus]XP_054009973.1 uncharacterized protein LOC128893180 isoform X1 [Hylaeus anthracinus]